MKLMATLFPVIHRLIVHVYCSRYHTIRMVRLLHCLIVPSANHLDKRQVDTDCCYFCTAQTLVHGDQFIPVYPAGLPSLPAYNGGYGNTSLSHCKYAFTLTGMNDLHKNYYLAE